MLRRLTALALVAAALAVVPSAHADTRDNAWRAIHTVFHTKSAQRTAWCLAGVESHYNEWRVVAGSSWSATGDHGLLQINYIAHHWPGESEWSFHRRMGNDLTNVRFAARLSHGGTYWGAWSTHALCGV